IRQQYGSYITNNVFLYGKLRIKLCKLKCDLIFLKVCKRENLLPKFVTFKIPSTHQHHQRAIQNCYRAILINEIKIKKRQLSQLYKMCKNLESSIQVEMDPVIKSRIRTIIKELEKEKEIVFRNRHGKKLEMLRTLQKLPSNIKRKTITTSPIKNYSKRTLTHDETVALENGLDFILPSLTFDEESFISNIETLFVSLLGKCSDKNDYEERESDELIVYNLTPEQLKLSNKLRKLCDTFRWNAYKTISRYRDDTEPMIRTLRNLSKDKSIHISRADKGRAVVILNKIDYNTKMESILNDTGAFKIIESDPTLKKEDMLQHKLLKLRNSGFITDAEYIYARPVGSGPGKAYGLPKIHKKDLPLRPIISTCNTFNYKLSKLLAKKLGHLRISPNIINDTFKFVDEIHSLRFNQDEIKLVSFDIISLFTKVPLDRTIEIILEQMYGKPHTCTFSNKKKDDWCDNCKNRYELKSLLEIATKDSHFIFNDKIYCQLQGIAMGSPLGPLFADVYINYLETKLKRRLVTNGVLYWKRFVDDSFVIVKKDADINKLLKILNSFDPAVQFTVEIENNGTIPFLDILISRNNNSTGSRTFTTTIYRKPTFTGLLLKWTSYVPMSYKISAISSMAYRAIRICST
ncbi:unnamed protein product, partial [Didymodactylos carnosus]